MELKETRALGKSGLKVPTLCLGTMTFGEADENSFMHKVGADEKTSFAIMDRALERGCNFFDTADVYGQDGLSERVIGKWFAKSQKRDQTILATKCRFRMAPGAMGTGASRYRIVRAVEESLSRLGTDRIDLYQIHMQDVETPEDETLRALDDLVSAGKVLYIGASNYAAYRMVDSLWRADSAHRVRFVSMQMQYSLVVREIEREHVSVCRDFGVGILPWSPLYGGLLSGKYRKGQAAPEGTRFAKWKERYDAFDKPRNWRIVDALDMSSKELGVSMGRIALAWLLTRPHVTSVIFGARSTAQLDDNLAAATLVLPAPIVKRLDEASALELGYPYDFLSRTQSSW